MRFGDQSVYSIWATGSDGCIVTGLESYFNMIVLFLSTFICRQLAAVTIPFNADRLSLRHSIFKRNLLTHSSIGRNGFERRAAGFHEFRSLGKPLIHWSTESGPGQRETSFLVLFDPTDSQAAVRLDPDCFSWRHGGFHSSEGICCLCIAT